MRPSLLPIALVVALFAAACAKREGPPAAPPAPEAPSEAAPAPTTPPEARAPEAVPSPATTAGAPVPAPAAPAPAAPVAAPSKPKATPAAKISPQAVPPAPGPTSPAVPPTRATEPPPTAAPAPPPTATPKAAPAPAARVVDPGGEVVVAATKPGLTRIGAEKCRVCHKVQHASWAVSGHAKRNPPLDCEGCHGPGSEYKALPVMKDPQKARAAGLVDPDAAWCGRCHKGPWDPALMKRAHAHKG